MPKPNFFCGIDALQWLVGRIKTECVSEEEIYE